MNTVNSSKLNDYNNLSGLQSIKYQAKSDKAGALDAVAKQFESVFVSMMIKSMRDANKGFSEGNLLQSSESDSYQQMFDSQLAVSLSSGNGIGLAEVIKRQLSKGVSGTDDKSNTSQAPSSFSLENYSRKAFSPRFNAEEMQQTIAKIESSVHELKTLGGSVSKETALNMSEGLGEKRELDFSNPDKFIQSLYPYAKDVEQDTGIDARVMLAQSALETGWGKHQILKQDGSPSFNLFGIKAQSDWEGDSAEITTTEYRGGLAMKEQANFRSYSSYGESFKDYAKFLQGNERYQSAIDNVDNPKAFAMALQDSGYATDPEYANKINRIMDRYISDVEKVDVTGGLK